MSKSVEVDIIITSMQVLLEGAKELGIAIRDLREAHDEMRYLENSDGIQCPVDYILQNDVGDSIGVTTNEAGHVAFVVPDTTSPTVKRTIDQVTQAYSRLKVLDEVSRRGYRKVKEEKLPNGSIRLVVERWQ